MTVEPAASSVAFRPAQPAHRGAAMVARQLVAVTRLELRRMVFALRTAPVYFLAALPVGICMLFAGLAMLGLGDDSDGVRRDLPVVFAGLFQFILRFSIFFSCVWLFINLIRGEMIDRSLHYYFLAPVRRELLVGGKFLAGVILSVAVFTTATAASMLLVYLPFSGSLASGELIGGGFLRQLASYVLVSALACVGYGALFLCVGLYVRNPILPALVVSFIESIQIFLPTWLQRISVIYYLESLKPYSLSGGGIAILGEPTPVWVSIPGILVVTAALTIVSGRRSRTLEIDYSAD